MKSEYDFSKAERGKFFYPDAEFDLPSATADHIEVFDEALVVSLSDGRKVSTPLSRYPRLMHGTPAERDNWRLIGGGYGIHWPDLDEDLSVEGLLLGKPSMESQSSFKRWLERRQAN